MDGLCTMGDVEELEKLLANKKKTIEKEVEDRKKVEAMMKETDNLSIVADACKICFEPLLKDIGEKSFGIVSFHCKCSMVRTIHLSCCLAPEKEYPVCAFCRERVSFIVPGLADGVRHRRLPVLKNVDDRVSSFDGLLPLDFGN